MAEKSIKVGTRVRITGKEDLGTVAFIGTTLFQTGKWIGVELDEPKGKNNGTVQGKSYFNCPDNHGIFVRASQLTVLNDNDPTLQPVDGSPIADDSMVDDSSSSFYGSESNLASAEKPDKKASRLTGIKTPAKSESAKSLVQDSKLKLATKPGLKLPTSSSKTDLTSAKQVENAQDAKTAVPSKPDSLPNVHPVSVPKIETTPADLERTAPVPLQASEGTSTPVSRVSAADIGAMSTSINVQMENLHQQQEIEGLKSEIKDLQEKLETLRIKRGQDVARLKDFEKVKIQLEQMQEYKTKMQESQNDLQRQLQAAKKEASDVAEQFAAFKEEMSEAQESIEMATLDKEMAEEKCESLQLELQQWKEKAEELSLDLQILKEDIATPAEGGFSTHEKKQLEQQNERLKEALVKLRELANYEKQESLKAQKVVEALKSEITSLMKDKERLDKQVAKLLEEAIELKEQVDVAQGAEEMVEKLTEKTLLQEEKLEKLEEEKADLEALCEMNDELQETSRETELELRDMLDQSHMKLNEANRKVDALNETILDYQSTIVKFRELVLQLQNKIKEQADNPTENNSSSKPESTPTIEFDFKTKFAETKAVAKAIDLELRKLDVEQANKHVSYLCSFMPENFFKIGGDHDAVLTLLFMPRMISKCDILMSHIKEKFGVPDELSRDDVVKTHKSLGFGFSNNLVYNLSVLQGYFRQFDNVLGTCGVDMLLKIGTLLPEIAIYEKTIDSFIDLLRKDQLDETISLESLEKTITYFQHLYSVHFAQHKPNCTQLMNLQMQTLTAVTNCISTDVSSLKHAMQPGQLDVTVTNLLTALDEQNNELKAAAKKIKRRIPDNTNATSPMSFSKEVQSQMAENLESLGKVVKTIRLATSATSQLLAVLEGHQTAGEDFGLDAKQLEEVFLKATEKIFGRPDSENFEDFKRLISECAQSFKQISLAMENGEYDFDGTPEKLPMQPVVHRANAVKLEFAGVDNLKSTLEAKEKTVQELKTQLKNKQDDLGQSVLRMQVLEKKLETVNKEADDRMDKIQQKLDEATMELRKKEKEHEEGMDALQADIDNLEAEKTELQKKLKELSKKSLFAGLAKQLASPENSEASETPVKEGSIAAREVASLRETIRFLSLKNAELVGEKLKNQFSYLPALEVPKKFPEIDEELQQLQREAKDLMTKTQKVLLPKLIDITKCKKGVKPQGMDNPLKQAAVREAELASIRRELEEFETKVTKKLASKKRGGHARTDFGQFATPSYLRMMKNQLVGSMRSVGVISIPCQPGQGCAIPLEVNANQLNEIHARLCC